MDNADLLFDAIARNDADECLRLIDLGVDLDARDAHQRTFLRLACQQDAQNMWPVVRGLVILGSNWDAPDVLGYTPRQASDRKMLEDDLVEKWNTMVAEANAERQARVMSEQTPGTTAVHKRATL